MCQFDIISILQRAKSNTLRPGAATDCSKTNNYLDLWITILCRFWESVKMTQETHKQQSCL